MKVKQKLVLLVATGLLGTVIVTGAAMLENRQAAAQRDRQGTVETALRNHVDGDMMHDAIRADVLSAILAARSQDAAAGRKA